MSKKITDETILDCGHKPSEHGPYTTGYGTDAKGKTRCYDCCADVEREWMREHGNTTLYLAPAKRKAEDEAKMVTGQSRDTSGEWKVTDWPGKLSIPVDRISKGRHNIAGVRYDVWFRFEGRRWHGVQYGDWTQICHCRRLKEECPGCRKNADQFFKVKHADDNGVGSLMVCKNCAEW